MALETVFRARVNYRRRVAQFGKVLMAVQTQLTGGFLKQVLSVRAVHFMTRSARIERYRRVDRQGRVCRDIVVTLTAYLPLFLFQKLGVWSGVTVMAIVAICRLNRRVREGPAGGLGLIAVAITTYASRCNTFRKRDFAIGSGKRMTGVTTAFSIRCMCVRRDQTFEIG